MQVFTIVSIGVLGAILALTVRQFRPEAGLFIGIATGALVLLLTMPITAFPQNMSACS